MQVALCMKFLRFPIHDQVTAQCIIQMQDVLSAAAQSEPKRGRRTCRGGGLEGASLLSCCQLDAQAAWSLGGPQGGGGIMESLGGEIPKRHHVNGQRASLKHQTRDNSTPVNGRLSDPFRANTHFERISWAVLGRIQSSSQVAVHHPAFVPASAFQSGGVPTLVH